jgi:Lrp/AsnC family leucine-responsive transcriptional regulator
MLRPKYVYSKITLANFSMKVNNDGSFLIDDKDRLLLSILQESAEISLSELGKKVGLSKMSISNRIRRLKELGIIEGPYFKVKPEKLGEDYVLITRIICNHKGLGQEKIANAIAKLPGVMSVYLVFGTSDISLIARRKDKSSAKQLLYDISRIPGVRNTVTMIPHTVIKESLAVDVLSKS